MWSKGRVERQVAIVRDHVLAGRSFDSLDELDAAFADWLPIRRAQVHRTHGQVIAVRAESDRAALRPLPAAPYLVADRHLRRVGKDALVSFEASLYSVPARRVRPGQRVELRVTGDLVAIHALTADTAADAAEEGSLLACHPRATQRGSWVVDPAHWEGLPDGHTRATCLDPAPDRSAGTAADRSQPNPLAALLAGHPAAGTPVATRPLAAYEQIAGLGRKRGI